MHFYGSNLISILAQFYYARLSYYFYDCMGLTDEDTREGQAGYITFFARSYPQDYN